MSNETVESLARDIEARMAALREEIEMLSKAGKGLPEGADSARAAQRLLLLASRDVSDAAVRLYTLIRQSEARRG